MSLNRKYLLRIDLNKEQLDSGIPEDIDAGTGGGKIKPPSTGDLITIASDKDVDIISIDNLQLVAKIPSSKKSSTNSTPATITLYNLSTDTLSKIKPESTLILQAGYESDDALAVVYVGQVVKIKPEKNGVDRTVRLVCSAAYTITKNVRISKSWPPGKTFKQIIDELVKELGNYGLPLGAFNTEPQEPIIDNPPSTVTSRLSIIPEAGFAVNGYLMPALESLCESVGFKCYIALSKLYIEPKEYPKTLEIVTLSQDHIIGGIRPEKDTSKSLTGSSTNKTGISVTTLLDGRITLAKKVEIASGPWAGHYDVESVTHSLSYEGKEWYTKMKLVGITGD